MDPSSLPVAQALPSPLSEPGESARLAVLHSLQLIDRPIDPGFEALARSTSLATDRAVAMVSLVDDRQVWHVARHGIDVSGTPRPLAFCSEAIRHGGFFEVPDLRLDERFARHPLVQGPAGWRHYAAATLTLEGQALGTLCVLDTRPGPLTESARAALLSLGELACQLLGLQRQRVQLEEQVERLRDLSRATGDWAWELDAELRQCWISGELEAVTGLRAADCLGRPLDAEVLVDVDGHPQVPGGSLLDVLAQRQPFSRVLSRMSCPRGSLVISRSATPVFDPAGRFKGYRGSARDVTARLERENLLRDKATLESVSRERSQFLSRVSHELRTPLNAILGFTQLMHLDPPPQFPATHQQRLDGIERAGHHLLELINDVLDIVRLEQGGAALALSSFELEPVLRRAVAAQQPAARSAGVLLSLHDPGPMRVRGNAQALGQVLAHLLSNAIKYNRPQGRVEVRADLQGPWTRISVRDTGQGLGPDEIPRLFQPFSRPGAERHRIDGSGLGLVLAHELAQAMGAHLNVSSSLGEGSDFQIELPSTVASAAPTAAPARAPTPPKSVLYIEDEPLNVLLMQELFKARPEWTLHVAPDGAQGVEMARRLRPDLALVDMNLPDFGGLEVLRRLRAHEDTRALHCVALSADAMREQIDSALAAGFQDYWTKPIDLSRLLDAVAQALGAKTAD